MARILPSIICLVLSWSINFKDAASSSDVYFWSPAATSRRPTTAAPRTTSTPNRPYPPPVYWPPPAYQPNPAQGYQPNPPPAYQPNPAQGYQPNQPATHPRPTSRAYFRSTSTTQRPNPRGTYQRNPSSSYHRNPPGRNPYGYGEYTVVEKCTNPSLPFRIFAYKNNTSVFWRIPRMPQAGDEIMVGRTRKGRSIWVLEFVNVTSSDPKYLIRTNGSNPLYVTYNTAGEVSLQQQVTQQSYFMYDIRGGGGSSYRVPGTNRSIGMTYGKLRIQNGQYVWYDQIPQQFMNCQQGWSQHMSIKKHLSEEVKWYYDEDSLHDDVLADDFQETSIEARWISKEHGWGPTYRDFRSRVPPNKYVTWSFNYNRLEFQTKSESEASSDKRLFRIEMEDFGLFQLSTPTDSPYVRIENMPNEDDVLGLGGSSDAVTWTHTYFGECCGSDCKPTNLHRTCVSELVVASSIQLPPPRVP